MRERKERQEGDESDKKRSKKGRYIEVLPNSSFTMLAATYQDERREEEKPEMRRGEW